MNPLINLSLKEGANIPKMSEHEKRGDIDFTREYNISETAGPSVFKAVNKEAPWPKEWFKNIGYLKTRSLTNSWLSSVYEFMNVLTS